MRRLLYRRPGEHVLHGADLTQYALGLPPVCVILQLKIGSVGFKDLRELHAAELAQPGGADQVRGDLEQKGRRLVWRGSRAGGSPPQSPTVLVGLPGRGPGILKRHALYSYSVVTPKCGRAVVRKELRAS